MVTVNTLFKYAFPTQITQATPDIDLSFLKKVLVIVLDATSTDSQIQEITKTNIPIGYEFLNGGFSAGLETIYLKQVTSLDLSAEEDLSLSFYNILVLDITGTLIEDVNIKLNHDGYIAKMLNSNEDTIFSPFYCDIVANRNYIGCYNMGILFANNNNYSAKQYISSTDATVLASTYSDITTLNNMFTNGMFWGYDTDFGVRLYGSFNNGDDILATDANLNIPVYITGDASYIYVTDLGYNRVRKINKSTSMITTVIGNGSFEYNGDNIQATSAGLNQPRGLGIDTLGNIYVADSLNLRVRKVYA
jgi:hypothetical protein